MCPALAARSAGPPHVIGPSVPPQALVETVFGVLYLVALDYLVSPLNCERPLVLEGRWGGDGDWTGSDGRGLLSALLTPTTPPLPPFPHTLQAIA